MEVVLRMAKKLTKTQMRRAYLAIKQKSTKVWEASNFPSGQWIGNIAMSTPDLVAIEKIVDKYLKRF